MTSKYKNYSKRSLFELSKGEEGNLLTVEIISNQTATSFQQCIAQHKPSSIFENREQGVTHHVRSKDISGYCHLHLVCMRLSRGYLDYKQNLKELISNSRR